MRSFTDCQFLVPESLLFVCELARDVRDGWTVECGLEVVDLECFLGIGGYWQFWVC